MFIRFLEQVCMMHISERSPFHRCLIG